MLHRTAKAEREAPFLQQMAEAAQAAAKKSPSRPLPGPRASDSLCALGQGRCGSLATRLARGQLCTSCAART